MIEPPLASQSVVYSMPQMTPLEPRKFPFRSNRSKHGDLRSPIMLPPLALAASFRIWQLCRPVLPHRPVLPRVAIERSRPGLLDFTS
jgi:hypothetical protein